MARSPHFAARALALLVAASAVAWLLLAAFEPLRLNWGDPWSDANVLTTLEYSAKPGFWKASFTDVLDIGPLTTESYRYGSISIQGVKLCWHCNLQAAIDA